METITKTYDNGLRLVLAKNDKNVVAVNILVGVGSNYEQTDEEGFSHFIEHMVFKSSEKFSTNEIMENLTFYGAEYNAFTSKDITCFVFMCLKENFEKCFEIYSDMLISPKFLEEEMSKEREVVIEEMKRYADQPRSVLQKEILNNYFDGTTFAHEVLGREEIIANVSRERLLEYKNKYYTADNIVISVAGNIEFEELDQIVTKYFASGFKEKRTPKQVCKNEIEVNIKTKYAVVQRPDNQANVCVHIKSVPVGDPKEYISELYSIILGGTSSSKLYKQVREELGLVYSIYSYYEAQCRNGEIYIVFGTRPKNLKKALSCIKENIINLNEKLTEKELEAAKNYAKSSLEYSNETNADLARTCAETFYQTGKVVLVQNKKQKYDEITLEDIKKFAQEIASEKTFNVVAVGNNIDLELLKIYK